MKKNIIVGLIFIVCLILVGSTDYYLDTKTIKPKVIETVVEKEPNIDEIKVIKEVTDDEAYKNVNLAKI